MGLREILQTEIWSKQTSRNILARIGKILVRLKFVGIGLAVVLVGIALWFFVWTHWLTEGERSKGKIALVQVDALQNFNGMSDTEFDTRSQQAQEKVNDAIDAAVTFKDRSIADFVDLYLFELKGMRQQKKVREQIYSRPGFTKPEWAKESDLKFEKSQDDLIKIIRDAVHESLSK
jgi:hypothetical protein